MSKYPEWIKSGIEEILKEDRIDFNNFNQKETWIKIIGSKRKAFIYPGDFRYEIFSNSMNLDFNLNKGSYATSLIREVNNSNFAENDLNSDQTYKNYNLKAMKFFIFPQDCKSLFNV